MAKDDKGTTTSGKKYLDLSLNPYPATYRHQDGGKQIVTRGHEAQTDHEIIITMPKESGTLAIIGGGGTIDLSNYYTKTEVNILFGDYNLELESGYYNKAQVDLLLKSRVDEEDKINDHLDALVVIVDDNAKDIDVLQTTVGQNSADILTNKSAHEKNATDISKNKVDIATNKASTNANTLQIADLKKRQPLVTLWQVGTPLSGAYGNDPAKGQLYMGDGTQVTNNFRNVTELYMNYQDYDGNGHTFSETKIGEVVDIVNGTDNKNFGRYTIISKTAKLDSELIVVELVSAAGTTKVTDVLAFQELPSIDGESVMLKEGGIFTGSIGTNRGSLGLITDETAEGDQFTVMNGNDDLHLQLTGDGKLNYYKPAGLTPEPETVATMSDVEAAGKEGDKAISLASSGSSMRYTAGTLGNFNFSVNNVDPKYVSNITLYKLTNNQGYMVFLSDYETTNDSWVEVYEEATGYMMFRALIKSSSGTSDVVYQLASNRPAVYQTGKNFTTSGYYSIILHNLIKK